MNRGVFRSSLVQQQMMEGSPNCWSTNNMKPPPELTFPLLPSSSSPSVLPQNPQPSDSEISPWQDSHDLLESWCQLLLSSRGGLVGEEGKYGWAPFQTKKMMTSDDPHDELLFPSATAHIADMKQEYSEGGYVHSLGNEGIQVSRSAWGQILPASSPRSCITTSFSTNILNFSNMARRQPDNSPECNSTETAPNKKARVQGSFSPKSTLKVRKEKLGDRITALHQLVSPFGKTDTASVLQEAIGYIRFLQSQIEALSSPYLQGSASGNMRQPARGNTSCLLSEDPAQFSDGGGMKGSRPQDQERCEEPKKDLRSRGLCLVPVSFTMHVGSDNGADFWAPALGGGF
ncbi:hypothetical protein MUK42_11638 [Musa troglodytarum]|uniref:BHLH domain-containing protein n=1 Tax=Musa troglodytarum TaxID=320322 RepID=A0A9E7KMY7_9LILI|nr:hypothetical protein MUK42_11638 [Musa troglodytarum]